jgi:hypothetical protein
MESHFETSGQKEPAIEAFDNLKTLCKLFKQKEFKEY